jgi:hypothetical protein
VRRLERVYEEYTVIQRNVLHVYDVIDLLLTKSLISANGWNIYSLIKEVLYAISLFTFSLQPNVVEAGKLQSWHVSDMTQNRFFIGYES